MYDYDSNDRLYNDDIYFLKLFRDYEYENVKINFEYDYKSTNLAILQDTYKLQDIMGSGNEFLKQIKLMLWVSSILKPNGECIPPPLSEFNSLNILNKSLNGNMLSNCWMHATVLNEILLAAGYKSRMIRCMPMELRFSDCHCVNMVYSNHYSKWFVLDATLGGVYYNNDGIPMNLYEIRNAILENSNIDIIYNRRAYKNDIIKYFSKNLIRFQCYRVSQFFSEDNKKDNTIINLNPKLYMLSDKEIINSEGRIIRHINISNPKVFWEMA